MIGYFAVTPSLCTDYRLRFPYASTLRAPIVITILTIMILLLLTYYFYIAYNSRILRPCECVLCNGRLNFTTRFVRFLGGRFQPPPRKKNRCLRRQGRRRQRGRNYYYLLSYKRGICDCRQKCLFTDEILQSRKAYYYCTT